MLKELSSRIQKSDQNVEGKQMLQFCRLISLDGSHRLARNRYSTLGRGVFSYERLETSFQRT